MSNIKAFGIYKGNQIEAEKIISPTRENYDFQGWQNADDQNAPIYSSQDIASFLQEASCRYIAIWGARWRSFTATFVSNSENFPRFADGEGQKTIEITNENDMGILEENVRAIEELLDYSSGHVFLGWSLANIQEQLFFFNQGEDGNDPVGLKPIEESENITFYAIWSISQEDGVEVSFSLKTGDDEWFCPGYDTDPITGVRQDVFQLSTSSIGQFVSTYSDDNILTSSWPIPFTFGKTFAGWSGYQILEDSNSLQQDLSPEHFFFSQEGETLQITYYYSFDPAPDPESHRLFKIPTPESNYYGDDDDKIIVLGQRYLPGTAVNQESSDLSCITSTVYYDSHFRQYPSYFYDDRRLGKKQVIVLSYCTKTCFIGLGITSLKSILSLSSYVGLKQAIENGQYIIRFETSRSYDNLFYILLLSEIMVNGELKNGIILPANFFGLFEEGQCAVINDTSYDLSNQTIYVKVARSAGSGDLASNLQSSSSYQVKEEKLLCNYTNRTSPTESPYLTFKVITKIGSHTYQSTATNIKTPLPSFWHDHNLEDIDEEKWEWKEE